MEEEKPKEKVCRGCGENKKLSEFGKRKSNHLDPAKRKKIFGSYCKKCVMKRTVAWQEKNKERYMEYNKKYHEEKQKKLLLIKEKNDSLHGDKNQPIV